VIGEFFDDPVSEVVGVDPEPSRDGRSLGPDGVDDVVRKEIRHGPGHED
jgi:hypothetical protein